MGCSAYQISFRSSYEGNLKLERKEEYEKDKGQGKWENAGSVYTFYIIFFVIYL